MILAKIVDDPQSGTCLNVSYADMPGPVANFNPTGSPYAGGTAAAGSTFGSNSTLSGVTSASGLMLNGAATGGLNLSLNLNQPQNVNPGLTAQLLEHVKVCFNICRNCVIDLSYHSPHPLFRPGIVISK